MVKRHFTMYYSSHSSQFLEDEVVFGSCSAPSAFLSVLLCIVIMVNFKDRKSREDHIYREIGSHLMAGKVTRQ